MAANDGDTRTWEDIARTRVGIPLADRVAELEQHVYELEQRFARAAKVPIGDNTREK